MSAFCDDSSTLPIPIYSQGQLCKMSDASDSQNMSEQHAYLSEGSSPEESFYEGERSSPDLPKAASKTRKKRTSDDEDEDFVASEATSKKKKVIAKE